MIALGVVDPGEAVFLVVVLDVGVFEAAATGGTDVFVLADKPVLGVAFVGVAVDVLEEDGVLGVLGVVGVLVERGVRADNGVRGFAGVEDKAGVALLVLAVLLGVVRAEGVVVDGVVLGAGLLSGVLGFVKLAAGFGGVARFAVALAVVLADSGTRVLLLLPDVGLVAVDIGVDLFATPLVLLVAVAGLEVVDRVADGGLLVVVVLAVVGLLSVGFVIAVVFVMVLAVVAVDTRVEGVGLAGGAEDKGFLVVVVVPGVAEDPAGLRADDGVGVERVVVFGGAVEVFGGPALDLAVGVVRFAAGAAAFAAVLEAVVADLAVVDRAAEVGVAVFFFRSVDFPTSVFLAAVPTLEVAVLVEGAFSVFSFGFSMTGVSITPMALLTISVMASADGLSGSSTGGASSS